MEDNMKFLLKAKYITEKCLQAALSKFLEDEAFKKYKTKLEDLFRTGYCETRKGGTDPVTTVGASTSREIVISQCKDEMEVVRIRSLPGMLTPVYYNPEFLKELETSERKYLEDSKAKKTLPFVDPPNLDEPTDIETPQILTKEDGLPTRTSTAQQETSEMKDKGKHTTDDTVEQGNHPHRRNIKLSDQLRSPYVIRYIDFQITSEDKKVHDWVIENFGWK
ncbi:hypothetical protein L6452_34371 [Arctium lappa]|uniref:Uncharacterized protein n=1 Tax=Arctium lappa TaxID=4217 RepID=A0ACB8YIR3_ARCLA|nr:hypothetical protein L6452_34371 [Arctium lappa]